MPDYYYQIKARAAENEYSTSHWAFPPLFSGKVSAESKQHAKIQIQEEYSRQFPLRVLKKDLDKEHYLLNIQEIDDQDDRTKSLFEFRACLNCQRNFRVIDLYNDHNEFYKGHSYCSDQCKSDHRPTQNVVAAISSPNSTPMIYQITNLKTGLSYIGQTTQVFTLRWYQHFYHGGSCKFHQAIKQSKFEDWQFRVLETVNYPVGITLEAHLRARERYWIDHYDTISNGYNTQ